MTQDMNVYSKFTDILTYSKRLLLLLLLTVGTNSAWGQVGTDMSGYYYFANKGKVESGPTYNSSTPETNCYLCPAAPENPPANYNYEAVYFDGNSKQKPYLTTYKTNRNDESIWRVKFAKTDNNVDYYYIIHYTDGKYLTHNTQGGTTRLRVHLQSLADGDNSLFAITAQSPGYNIRPKSISSGDRFLNPANGNKFSYQGVNSSTITLNGETVNTGGMIGLYKDAADAGSIWITENLSVTITDNPTITNNNDNTFTISATEGAIIYYTTDGTKPTTSTETTLPNSGTVTVDGTISIIKAIAKKTDHDYPSMEVTYELEKCERPVISVSNGTVTITTPTAGASICFSTEDDESVPSTPYNSSFSLGGFSVIRAITKKAGFTNSEEALYMDFKTVSSSSEIYERIVPTC